MYFISGKVGKDVIGGGGGWKRREQGKGGKKLEREVGREGEKWKGDIDNKEQIQLDMSVIPFL